MSSAALHKAAPDFDAPAAPVLEGLALMERFGFGQLPLEPLAAPALPATVRELLDHTHGMTAALEGHFGEPMALILIDSAEFEGRVYRQVLLRGADTGRAAELGLISIHLANLPRAVQGDVRAGLVPFGTALRRAGIYFESRPHAFFRSAADPSVSTLLGLAPGRPVYGRATALYDANGTLLAEATEVLAALPA